MIATLARFAKDSYSVWKSPLPTLKKAALWTHLVYPSQKMLGYKVSCFDRSTLIFLYREIFARQQYYFNSVNQRPIIFDCGANVGMATLYFKWLYPQARITAFEAEPNTFALLQKNVQENHLGDVETHNCAIWEQNGTVPFFIDPSTPGSLLMSTNQSRFSGERIEVVARKLSDFIHEPVDCLKLDIEGAEQCVLSELVRSGKIRIVRRLVVEYHHRIGNQNSCLANFLRDLEESGFEYQIHASDQFLSQPQTAFQDILIRAQRG